MRFGAFIQRQRFVAWEPDRVTLVAFGTLALMVAGYGSFGLTAGNTLAFAGALLLPAAIGVVLPSYYHFRVKRGSLDELGIHRSRLIASVLLSVLLTAVSMPQLLRMAGDNDLAPQLVTTLAAFWEPFFVFGWLQTRYEKAFGSVPAIILAGLSFGLYHILVFPTNAVLALVPFGIAAALIFRTTVNLAVLWPLFWTVGGAIGTYQNGVVFSWPAAAISLIIFFGQIAALVYLARPSRAIPRLNESEGQAIE